MTIGATLEDIIMVPVRAQDVPVGAMIWDGALIFKVRKIHATGEEPRRLVKFFNDSDGLLMFDEFQTVRVICGAHPRMFGKISFYDDAI